jgi:hypothetical protein
LQETPFSPSRISGKNDLSPPKSKKNVMSPPPQNSFRRPCIEVSTFPLC